MQSYFFVMRRFPLACIGVLDSPTDAQGPPDGSVRYMGFFFDEVKQFVYEYEAHLAKVNVKRKKNKIAPPFCVVAEFPERVLFLMVTES